MLQSKKTWNLIGMALGIAILVTGLILIFALPISTNWDYADYASFGADFYTYQYKATKVVASNTAQISRGLENLSEAIATAFGVLLIAVGALTSLNYGKKFFTEDMPEVVESVKAPDDAKPITIPETEGNTTEETQE